MTAHYADPDSNRTSTEIPKTVGGRPDEYIPAATVTPSPHERGELSPQEEQDGVRHHVGG